MHQSYMSQPSIEKTKAKRKRSLAENNQMKPIDKGSHSRSQTERCALPLLQSLIDIAGHDNVSAQRQAVSSIHAFLVRLDGSVLRRSKCIVAPAVYVHTHAGSTAMLDCARVMESRDGSDSLW